MHSKPMSESEGEFQDGMKPAIIGNGKHWPCPHCKVAGQVFYQLRDSHDGGFLDVKYTCQTCKKVWWVEGPDA